MHRDVCALRWCGMASLQQVAGSQPSTSVSAPASAALIASLPMYGVGLVDAANDALWQELCSAVPSALQAVPLRQPEGDLHEHWLDPDLAMSQTCGGPLVDSLTGRVAVVGTPHYDADGCEGPDYCSLLIARTAALECARERGILYFRAARAAINSLDSLSGCTALLAAAASELDRVDGTNREFFRELVMTGSHQASVQCVADRRADVAAIDCVTFSLLRAHRPDALEGVAVFGRTSHLPGLPIITAKDSPHLVPLQEAWRAIFDQTKERSSAQKTLLLKGFSPADDLTLSNYHHRVSAVAAAAMTVAGRARGEALRPFDDRSPGDSAFLRKSLQFVRDVLSQSDSTGLTGVAHPEWGGHSWQRFQSDGWGRLILPGGLARLAGFRSHALPTVCFLGTKRDRLERSVEEACWAVDSELIEKMTGREEVLLYASLPVHDRPESDWGNIVILQPGETSQCPAAGGFGSADWDTVHRREAVQQIAPKYYECVRLHRGELEGDLLWREGDVADDSLASFRLSYTTELNYESETTVRTCTRWLGNCL